MVEIKFDFNVSERYKYYICKSQKENCIDLYFRQFIIGRINTDKRCFEFKKAYLIEGDPRENLYTKV